MEKKRFSEILVFAWLHLYVLANEVEIDHESFGRLTDVGEVSFQVSIHLIHNDDFLCIGTIVSSNKVLSLAHCLYYSWGGIVPPIILKVKAVQKNIDENSQDYNVNDVQFHQRFNTSLMNFDLAVIEVYPSFSSDSSATDIISLAKQSSDAYTDCVVVGLNEETKDIRSLKVEIVDCYPGKICTRNVDINNTLCKHALGSSLVCDRSLVGILSIKPECNVTGELTVFENARNAFDLLGIEDNSDNSTPSFALSIQDQHHLNLISVIFLLSKLFV